MEIAALAFLIAAFVVGFLIAGRWFHNVFLQLLVGALMGMAIIGVLAAAFVGVAFAGCLFMAGGGNFH